MFVMISHSSYQKLVFAALETSIKKKIVIFKEPTFDFFQWD